MKSPTLCLSLLLGLVAWSTPEIDPASAAQESTPLDGLQHCVGADGETIFTDKRCSDLQAVQQVQAPQRPELPGVLVRVRSCARNQDDLLFGVRMALENRDVNRLADYYHWTGMGTREGYHLMDRLGAFSERPLVDVQLVSTASPEIDPAPEFDAVPDVFGQFQRTDAQVPPAAPRPPHPADLLRVDQVSSDTDLAVQATYFRLLSNAGCWWMQF